MSRRSQGWPLRYRWRRREASRPRLSGVEHGFGVMEIGSPISLPLHHNGMRAVEDRQRNVRMTNLDSGVDKVMTQPALRQLQV